MSLAHQDISKEKYAEYEKELNELMKKTGWERPIRKYLDDPTIKWKYAKPDYALADLTYFKGKSQNHKPGSLEYIVQNLVKTWEVEVSHKAEVKQMVTMDLEKFQVSANNGCPVGPQKYVEEGNYNVIMKDGNELTQKHYDTNCSYTDSDNTFRNCFPEGFAWEVLKVYSPPPVVAFSWRHWGTFSGEFKSRTGEVIQGKNKHIEMVGFNIAVAGEDGKLQDVKVYLDFDDFIGRLAGEINSKPLHCFEALWESFVEREEEEEKKKKNGKKSFFSDLFSCCK